jgi:hypothetical protein
MTDTMQPSAIRKMRKFAGKLKNMSFTDPEEELDETLSTETVYSPDGKVEMELRYNSNGQVEEKHEYIYDASGKVIEHNWSMPLDEVEQSEKTERDSEGRIVREVKLYYGEEGESTKYVYDAKGRMIEARHFDEEGTLLQEEIFEFNEKDKVSKRKAADLSLNKKQESKYIYNEKGLLKEVMEYDEKENLLSRTQYEQDEKDNDVTIVQYNPSGQVTQRVTTAYDEHGRMISRMASGFYTRVYAYEYDEEGRLIDEMTTDENGTLISRSSFEFDDAGRLVHETAYEKDLTHSGRDMAMAYRYEYE